MEHLELHVKDHGDSTNFHTVRGHPDATKLWHVERSLWAMHLEVSIFGS